MKNIEIYDILTLEDNIDYSVIRMIEKNDKIYYLLVEVDQTEKPNFNNMKIVEDNKDGTIEEIIDDNLLEELKVQFSTSLKEEI